MHIRVPVSFHLGYLLFFLVANVQGQTTLTINNASGPGDIADFVTGGITLKADFDFNGDLNLLGTNIGLSGMEGTGTNLTPNPGVDLLYPYSTKHCWSENLNNGTAAGECLTAGNGTWTPGDLLQVYTASGYDMIDTGISATSVNSTVCVQGQQTSLTGNGSDQTIWTCTLPGSLFVSPHSFTVYASWNSPSVSTVYKFKLGSTTIVTTSMITSVGGCRWEGKIVVTGAIGTNTQTADVRPLELPTSLASNSSAFATPTETVGSSSSIVITFNAASGTFTPEVFTVIVN